MKVMIADDHKTSRLIIAKYLKQLGFDEPTQASNGREALEKLPGSGVDLLFLDWHMPELDGIDALKQIRATPALAKLRVVMVTSEAHTDNIKQAIQLGISEYLVKPFDLKKFSEKLGKVLQKMRSDEGCKTPPVELLAAFVSKTIETINTMAGLSVKAGDIKREITARHAEICSVVGLTGKMTGAIVLIFPQKLASRLVGAMLPALDENELTDQIVPDGIEELLNVIIGGVRSALQSTIYEFEFSLTTTVRGNEEIAKPGKSCREVWTIPFVIDGEEFIAELRLGRM
jgi:two-component system, chemotaxis family, chemotaxis protein CheY